MKMSWPQSGHCGRIGTAFSLPENVMLADALLLANFMLAGILLPLCATCEIICVCLFQIVCF